MDVLIAGALDSLLDALRARGYACVGPTVRDGAIVYDEVRSAADLPRGMTDVQAPGHYRLARREDGALFGYAVGPHSWKKYLFPPETRLLRIRRAGARFERIDDEEPAPALAFVGVRACEVAALRLQDRVFTGGEHVEPGYARRRERAFVVAVSCTQSAATCFCASMRTGPDVTAGYDIALTEVLEPEHAFLVRAGSERGREVLSALPVAPAREEHVEAGARGVARAAREQTRRIDPEGAREVLRHAAESPLWEDVARRCLSCANCTMACPTCFCSSVEDVSDLTGEHAERWRRWDSCFNPDFSYVHGGAVRKTTASRYRQWMTHKLGTWFDQFGSSGCVGCGRCITWCPVGIDLTAEAERLRSPGERAGEVGAP